MNFIATIRKKLRKGTFNTKTFLSRLKFSDEAGRDSVRYTDPTYIPFYYYLGLEVKPKNVIEFGLNIGLVSGTFFSACKTVDHFLAFQQRNKEYYSVRLGRANVWNTLRKKFSFHYGNVKDDEFIKKVLHYKWDCVLINDEHDYQWYIDVIDLLWDQLNLGAVIVFDHLNSNKQVRLAYDTICRTKNREQVVIGTRYGVGIIER